MRFRGGEFSTGTTGNFQPELTWDTAAYFTGPLARENVPGYTRLDTQLSWRWSERGTINLVGQNLLRDHHFEFQDFTQSIIANQIKRSAYAQVSWRF